jgi:competence protein ComEA
MKISRFVATLAALGVAGLVLAGPVVAATAPAKASSAKPAPAGKINLNSATVEQLTTVPGVGRTLATRIVEHRQKEGSFKSVSELMNVKGVGEKNLAKIQGYFVVGEASRPAASK